MYTCTCICGFHTEVVDKVNEEIASLSPEKIFAVVHISEFLVLYTS